MGDNSKIEWTDASWNPVTGCSKVSPGCANCYAETLTQRHAKAWGVSDLPWTPENAAEVVRCRPERLEQPLRWKRPRMVFVNSMSDLFHEEVPPQYIAEIFAVMVRAAQHTFQVLTKRPERMRDLLTDVEFWLQVAAYIQPHDNVLANEVSLAAIDGTSVWAKNVWLGTSIENRRFVGRADELRATPAAVRFISAEPLLGPLVPDGPHEDAEHELYDHYNAPFDAIPTWADGYDGPSLNLELIDWLIVGGESGPGHRTMRPEWVRDLKNYCEEWCWQGEREGSTAFFFKQWGGRTPKSGGRELDGRTWDEMPDTGRVANV